MASLAGNLFEDLHRSVIDRGARSLMQRIETSTDPEADLVTTLESSVRWLRAQGVTDHLTILEALQGAATDAERITNRTLRQSVTRTIYYRRWSHLFPIPFPPLQSITSVKYYDLADTLQTITASDYEALTPTEGQGQVAFQADYSFPSLNVDRVDPIQIVAVTGWGSESTIPASAKMAIRFLVIAAHDEKPAFRDEAKKQLNPLIFRGPS